MKSLAIILYEDQRGPTKEFALHDVVMACVADELGVTVVEARRMAEGRPMKGVSNVLQTCRRDIRKLAARGQRVFAVIDNDHIREQLPGVDPRADDATVIRAIREDCNCPEQLEVILLHKNIESVIEAARDCGAESSAETVALALRKHLMQRDLVFRGVAWGRPEVRACIRGKMPALERLVGLLVRLARPQLVANDA